MTAGQSVGLADHEAVHAKTANMQIGADCATHRVRVVTVCIAAGHKVTTPEGRAVSITHRYNQILGASAVRLFVRLAI